VTLQIATVRFAPASIQPLAQTPAIPAVIGIATPKVETKRFVLTIDGLDCSEVISIGAITVKIPPGGTPQVSSLTLKMNDRPSVLAAWKTWFETLAANAASSDAQEKQGTLVIADRKNVLLTLQLKGRGIVRITRSEQSQACPKGPLSQEVELYCEGLTVKPEPPPVVVANQRFVHEPGGRLLTLTPLQPSTEAPAPPTVAPPATATEDKGARDPEGAPRFAGSVRTSFTATRTKTYSEETAEYTAKSEPAKVEAFFAEELKARGWTPTTRSEGGKEAAYRIDVRWEQGKQQAKVLIGKSKEGLATILVSIVTLIK
jgi:hypothetical protein